MSAAPARALVALLAMPVALLGCSGDKGPTITFRLAGKSVGGAERCGATEARDGAVVPSGEVARMRVTLVGRNADGVITNFCDRSFEYAQPPNLSLTARSDEFGNAATIDILAEAFAPAQPGDRLSLRRLATGGLLHLDPKIKSPLTLRMYRAEEFGCAGARLITPRAFHTATLLPDGRVLFVGGLVANANDPNVTVLPLDGITATGTAELYDPRDQTIVAVSEASPPRGRAFHAAQLLRDTPACADGSLAILLVGGLSPTEAGRPMLGTSRGMQGGRLVPFDMGTIPRPLGARAADNEILCLDLATTTATRVAEPGAAAAFRAAGAGPVQPDGTPRALVVAGGIDYDAMALNTVVARNEVGVFPVSGMRATLAPTGGTRSGATLTVLDRARALVWGGGASAAPVADLLTGLDVIPASTPVTPMGATPVTQFHTATLVDAPTGRVLLTGGFEITSGGVNLQPPPATSAVRLATVANTGTVSVAPVPFGGTYTADPACSEATRTTRYAPAGWESAVALPRGRALITGGTPSTLAGMGRCADCPTDPPSLLCALAQASLFSLETGTLSPAPSPMQISRFGHTSVVLDDGTVLVAGGIGGETVGASTTTVVIRDLEVYNPRAAVPPYEDATGLDRDDPFFEELMRTGVVREPGAEATLPDQPTVLVRQCGTL